MKTNATSEKSHDSPVELHKPIERAALSDPQRALVRDNIGLIYVHLKNHVTPHRIPWTRREWDDLVQEGCLGLIRAAQDFDPQGTIPFAAFALPRIHTSVRRMMLRRFGSGVAFAGKVSPSKGSYFGNAVEKPDWSPRKRRRVACEDDPLDALGDWWGTNDDTLGARMREKYERAVHRAVASVQEQDASDEACGEMLRALASDRHLVPDAHMRMPYRRIANRIHAPYMRLIRLDHRLRLAIQGALECDPEFAELQRMARAEPRGFDTSAEVALNQSLARLGAAELLQRLLHTSGERREKLAARLFDQPTDSLIQAIRSELETLPVAVRENLLNESSPIFAEEFETLNPAKQVDSQPTSNVSSASPVARNLSRTGS